MVAVNVSMLSTFSTGSATLTPAQSTVRAPGVSGDPAARNAKIAELMRTLAFRRGHTQSSLQPSTVVRSAPTQMEKRKSGAATITAAPRIAKGRGQSLVSARQRAVVATHSGRTPSPMKRRMVVCHALIVLMPHTLLPAMAPRLAPLIARASSWIGPIAMRAVVVVCNVLTFTSPKWRSMEEHNVNMASLRRSQGNATPSLVVRGALVRLVHLERVLQIARVARRAAATLSTAQHLGVVMNAAMPMAMSMRMSATPMIAQMGMSAHQSRHAGTPMV